MTRNRKLAPLALAVAADPPPTVALEGKPLRFVFAREFGQRAAEINDFYNGFTGKSRSLAAHHWEFQAGSSGPALMWTITDVQSARVVGHHSVIPTPLVCRGVDIAGGRTENTIVDPAVRTKIFYPGMEKRALTETLQTLGIVYTIHATGPGKLRLRLGYKPVGRWTAYLPKAGPRYLRAILERGRKAVSAKIPDGLLKIAANIIGRLHTLNPGMNHRPTPLDIAEIRDVAAIAGEYMPFWSRARQEYDLTIDRSLDFLRWRIADNPHLQFRTWALRRDRALAAIVIAHRHTLGDAAALYIDDIIAGQYAEAEFNAVLHCLPALDPAADTIVLMTLAVDTPLHRALQRQFPLQSLLLRRLGSRLFDEMLVMNRDGVGGDRPWYVTAIFSEGMDTSR